MRMWMVQCKTETAADGAIMVIFCQTRPSLGDLKLMLWNKLLEDDAVNGMKGGYLRVLFPLEQAVCPKRNIAMIYIRAQCSGTGELPYSRIILRNFVDIHIHLSTVPIVCLFAITISPTTHPRIMLPAIATLFLLFWQLSASPVSISTIDDSLYTRLVPTLAEAIAAAGLEIAFDLGETGALLAVNSIQAGILAAFGDTKKPFVCIAISISIST